MAKTKKAAPKKSEAKKPTTLRWMLGVFVSASSGELIAVYCRKDGSVAPYYAKTVKAKKALFAASYKDMTYAEARAQLFKDATKAGVKAPKKEEKELSTPKLRRAA